MQATKAASFLACSGLLLLGIATPGMIPAAAAQTAAPVVPPPGIQPVISANAADVSVSPPRAPLRDFSADARQMEQLAAALVERTRIPGLAMAIVQNGKVLSVQGYGVTDTRSQQPVTVDTVYRLASLSKAFASTLSALLIRDGALRWDTRISSQLPAFKLADLEGSQNLTVRDILSHRVGLTHNTYDRDLEANEPYPLLRARLGAAPLKCQPSDCYAYQNVAFSLIGDIVFAVTGDVYSYQVEKRIFHPLGMYNSTYGRDALEASASWAPPNVRARGGWVSVRPKETYYHVPPAAGVNASIHDMAQWLIAQMGHQQDVLPVDVLKELHTPQVATPTELRGSAWRQARLTDAYYALGWRIYDYAGHTLVFHGGAVQGYRTLIGFLPDQDIGMVVLWNSESGAPTGLMPTLLDRALGLPAHDWVQLDKYRAPVSRRRR